MLVIIKALNTGCSIIFLNMNLKMMNITEDPFCFFRLFWGPAHFVVRIHFRTQWTSDLRLGGPLTLAQKIFGEGIVMVSLASRALLRAWVVVLQERPASSTTLQFLKRISSAAREEGLLEKATRPLTLERSGGSSPWAGASRIVRGLQMQLCTP